MNIDGIIKATKATSGNKSFIKHNLSRLSDEDKHRYLSGIRVCGTLIDVGNYSQEFYNLMISGDYYKNCYNADYDKLDRAFIETGRRFTKQYYRLRNLSTGVMTNLEIINSTDTSYNDCYIYSDRFTESDFEAYYRKFPFHHNIGREDIHAKVIDEVFDDSYIPYNSVDIYKYIKDVKRIDANIKKFKNAYLYRNMAKQRVLIYDVDEFCETFGRLPDNFEKVSKQYKYDPIYYVKYINNTYSYYNYIHIFGSKHLTDDIIVDLVKKNCIDYIPDAKTSQELVDRCVEVNPSVLKHTPVEFRTDELMTSRLQKICGD